jgi:hypothetical protein
MQAKNKIIQVLIVFVLMGSTISYAQGDEKKITLTAAQAQQLYDDEVVLKKWVQDLQTPGVIVEGENMVFSEEALKLINDETYRKSVYKDKYSLLDIKESIGKNEIQKAFWQMINLYPENKQTVLEFIYAYDSAIPSDKVVVASFYTYAFFDPEITKIENGKPNVYRPDIFEEYFRRTKEIVSYIAYFRKEGKHKH